MQPVLGLGLLGPDGCGSSVKSQDLRKCANCLTELQEQESRTFQDGTIVYGANEITIMEASNELLDLPPRLDLSTRILIAGNFKLCFKCHQLLTRLYSAFKEFVAESRPSSFIHGVVEERSSGTAVSEMSLPDLWITQQVSAAGENGSEPDPSQPDQMGTGGQHTTESAVEDIKLPGEPSRMYDDDLFADEYESDTELRRFHLDMSDDDSDSDSDNLMALSLSLSPEKYKNWEQDNANAEEPEYDEIDPDEFLKGCEQDDSRRRYPCPECSEKFSRSDHLRRHIKCHSEKNFHCPICDAGFKQEFKKEEHIKSVHLPDYIPLHKFHPDDIIIRPPPPPTPPPRPAKKRRNKDPSECGICGRVLPGGWNIKSHVATHQGEFERLFHCDICKNAFKTNSALQGHKKIHENIRNFVCKACGMAFKRKYHLTEHEEVQHADQPKSYVCEVPGCNKTFRRLRNLKTHGRSHGATRYVCSYGCGVTFTFKSNQTVHQQKYCPTLRGSGKKKRAPATTTNDNLVLATSATLTQDENYVQSDNDQSISLEAKQVSLPSQSSNVEHGTI